MPVLASSSAFSLPHSPMCAAIHRISRVLVDPSALRVSKQSLVVLLLVESNEIACIEMIDLDTKGNTQIWLENFVYYIARAYKKEIN